MAVVNLTTFNRSGVSDWILQRASSVLMLAYALAVASAVVPDTSYEAWSEFMTQTWMRAFSTLALLAMIAHAWIGVWGVLTDYVTVRMLGALGDRLRLFLLVLMGILLLVYLFWGVFIIWGFI